MPEDWLKSWRLLALKGGEGLRVPRSQASLLDALVARNEGIATDRDFDATRRALRSFREVEQKAEPRGFKGELRPYQRDALGWFDFLRKLGFGGCLADDRGLGKTVQVLALLESSRVGLRDLERKDLERLLS